MMKVSKQQGLLLTAIQPCSQHGTCAAGAVLTALFQYFGAVKHTLHPNGKTPGGWLDGSPSYSSLTSASTVWGLCQQLPGSKVHSEQLAKTARLSFKLDSACV
ncbi:TPA: hypothetical protein ACH3X3_006526 [Trebouxia sp. C0006]